MLGPLLALLSFSPDLPASASITCPEGPASCDSAQLDADADVRQPAQTPEVATPAVIDCRVRMVTPVLLTLVGECDASFLDASYRASRYPESEMPTGALAPATTDRRGKDRRGNEQISAAAGIPYQSGEGNLASPHHHHPLALFALPDQPYLAPASLDSETTALLASRQISPPDRPPRF